MRLLPFEGYSWQISQHEIAFTEPTTLALLGTAQQFDGQPHRQYSDELNAFIAERNILTENLRQGKESPWRDYQQVLAELGLIVSTKTTSVLELTSVGRAYLAGNLPFTAMMTTQLFRYQYPNGQKDRIAGQDSNAAIVSAGVSIRPAVTLLKILLELRSRGLESISVEEIAAFILPNKTDDDWMRSITEITNGAVPNIPWLGRVRRNIRAWIRILVNTPYFSTSSSFADLSLSSFARSNMDQSRNLADQLLRAPLWIPDLAKIDFKRDWFGFYGSLGNLIPELESLAAEEIGDVFYNQPDDSTDDFGNGSINLREFSEIDTSVRFNEGLNGEDLLNSMRRGREKLAFGKSEHDRIVNAVAQIYRGWGFKLDHDPQSVDLLATAPNGLKKIVEVKTVNPVNFGKQIRHALGQVLEYDFRLMREGCKKTERIVVVNRKLTTADWRFDFCAHYNTKLVSTANWTGL